MRAILLERGLVFAAGRCKFERAVDTLLEERASGLSERIHRLVAELRDEWKVLDTKIAALNAEFLSLARDNLAARRLTTIPGIGVLNATALIAAIGNASGFDRARDLGAWLGLVPRQFTTGGKPRLLGITKRGNVYLRTLLVHGARAAMPTLSRSDTPLGQWLRGLLSRGMHRNVVIVALANKLARIAWAVLRKDCPFERAYGATAA
jgi:transposase